MLTVEGGTVPGRVPTRWCDTWCETAFRRRRRRYRRRGVQRETIIEETTAEDVDLLVKGAYTQNRLRQLVFGGATRHILSHAELPVLMAH